MDESRGNYTIARRFALAAAICCSTTSGYADQPARQSLSHLLSQGWLSPPPAAPAAEVPAAAKVLRPASRILQVPRQDDTPSLISETVAGTTPTAATPAATVDPQIEANTVPSTAAARSLAELIKRRTRLIVVANESAAVQNADRAPVPSVRRLDPERSVAERLATSVPATAASVRAAEPIHSEPAELPISAALPDTEATVDPPAIAASDSPGQGTDEMLSMAEPPTPTSSGQTTSSAASETSESPAEGAPPALELPQVAGDTTDPAETLDQEPASIPPADSQREIESESGLSLLPLKNVDPHSATELTVPLPSLATSVHTTRLREIAQESLRNAKHRLERNATHSARKYAMEALRSIVAMRDAQVGGNQHARQLEIALDAIRESADFCGRFGAVDANAMRRMVTVHETQVLKDAEIEHLSSLEATEMYLEVARQNLVLAAGDAREASDAMVLLGRIEKEIAQHDDTHASAVALTLQRAAVDAVPTNAAGYRELGTTLLNHGLVEQAALALHRSIEIQPTRTGYQRLLEASRRLGDADTARVCLASLQNPELLSDIPVQTLTPEQFAATGRTDPAAVRSAQPKQSVEAEPATVKQKVTSVPEAKNRLKSLFFGGRRK